jgi:hypothetical protein
LGESSSYPEFAHNITDSNPGMTVLRHHLPLTQSLSGAPFIFGNLPVFVAEPAMPTALGEKIHVLLQRRHHHDVDAAEAIEQLTILNDALGVVLSDTELLIWRGCPIRGTDLLSALLTPESPGRRGAWLPSSVAGLSEWSHDPLHSPNYLMTIPHPPHPLPHEQCRQSPPPQRT